MLSMVNNNMQKNMGIFGTHDWIGLELIRLDYI